MKIVAFGPGSGRHIEQYGSDFEMSRLVHVEGSDVSCMYLGPGGLIGHHPASTYQLFIVVNGEGWVESEDRQRVSITSGEAAFWAPGEHHGAGTESGMTVIVVEGNVLGGDPKGIGPN